MAIRYVLHLNPFNKGKGTYCARTRSIATLDVDQIIEHGENRGGWGAHPTLVKAILARYFGLVPMLLLEGYRLMTPIGEYWLVIEGEFETVRERMNPNKHQLRIVSAVPPDTQRRARNQARFEFEHGDVRRPLIESVCDAGSCTCDRVITRGGSVTVRGDFLKFDPTDDAQGVFLKKGGAEHRIDEVITNKPKTLIVSIPDDLPAGDYRMYVRARPRHTSKVREGVFGRRLRLIERRKKAGSP